MSSAVNGTGVLEHPQPLGVFGLPAGFLLVPAGEQTEAAQAALLRGVLPEQWPAALRFHELVHAGHLEEAAAVLVEGEPLTAYHRWLLDPSAEGADAVRDSLPESARPLVAIVLAALGQGPAPALGTDAPSELRALAAAARATEAVGRGDLVTSLPGLRGAADLAEAEAPVLAAVLRASAAMLRHDLGDAGAATDLESSMQALVETDLAEVRADLALRLGSIRHEAATAAADETGSRELLHEAMQLYYLGLSLVGEESEPFLWANLNLNLATAQLSLPMATASDQLRLGVATQALRACRRVFTPREHPGQWTAATMNLANSLVYTPSTHQGQNIMEAVALYDEVLESGIRGGDGDPVGRARLLTNRGNALAHAGALDEAHGSLVEARALFEQALDHDGALTVRGILDEIRKARVSDPDEELADLARQAEQMSRMPAANSFSSGMGVTIMTTPDATPPPKPTVTIVDPSTRPTDAGNSADPGDSGDAS
ncbi:MAG: hypothetical protein Q4G67_04030 [Actinomycetia bacterium]|nr:hypothetical protein [Actinomycetes bacterium]